MSKTKVAVKQDVAVSIEEKVDRLGVVRANKSKLEKEENTLKEDLKVVLVKEGDSRSGKLYEATLQIPDATEVDNKKLLKKIGQDKFNALASFTLKSLKEIMGDEDIDAVTKMGKGAPRIVTKKI